MCQFIESIRIEDGKIYNIDYHTQRLNHTRTVFWNDATFIDLLDIIKPPFLSGIQKCRIVYGKEIQEVTYTSYQMKEVSSLHLVFSDKIDYAYKSTKREELNNLYSQRKAADDILIVKNGLLTDTSIANIALYDGKEWFTPLRPLLKGTKRSELLDKQMIIEKEIPWNQLRKYSHIMLLNAMIDWGKIVIPVNERSLIV